MWTHLGSWSLAQFIIGAALGIFALPFVFVSSTSLYSKILSPTIQGKMIINKLIMYLKNSNQLISNCCVYIDCFKAYLIVNFIF